MKTISAYEVIMAILAKKDTCYFYDINKYREAHWKTHPDEYLEVDRDSIMHAIGFAYEELYWVCDSAHTDDHIIRQEVFVCPIDGHKTLKYPDVERFEALKKKVRDVIKVMLL
jgi:hypothetical protein